MAAKNLILLGFALLFLCVSAAFSYTCGDLVKTYGNRLKLPSTVSSFFNGETITVTAYNSSDSMTGSGKIGNYGIESIKCGPDPSSDYNIKISERALCSLSGANSKTQISTFISYMKKGEIQITAKGWVQKFKLNIAETVLNAQK